MYRYMKLYCKYVDLLIKYKNLQKRYDDIVYCIDNEIWEEQEEKGARI